MLEALRQHLESLAGGTRLPSETERDRLRELVHDVANELEAEGIGGCGTRLHTVYSRYATALVEAQGRLDRHRALLLEDASKEFTCCVESTHKLLHRRSRPMDESRHPKPVATVVEDQLVTIDEVNFTVRQRGSDLVPFGNSISFRLLVYLHANRGRPVSVKELYREVWGSRGTLEPSAVYKGVSRLRKELRDAGLTCVTVSRAGKSCYRLQISEKCQR